MPPRNLIMALIESAWWGIVMLCVYWGMLRLMDKAAGLDFRHTIDKIEQDPRAAAEYFGRRAIAVAIIVSIAFWRLL